MIKWFYQTCSNAVFRLFLNTIVGLGLLRKAWLLVGPNKTYFMSVTIFCIIFLIPHLLSEHKQLMPRDHPLSPIRYLQPSLNLLLWLASSIFWKRKYWKIIIIPNNSTHARVCWASPRWTRTPPGSGFFRVLWPAMADILRSQKPLEEEARGQPALAQTHASMDISGLRTQDIIRQTI